MSAKVHASTSSGASTYQGSHVYQKVTYTSAQGTKSRPHPPPVIYENPFPQQLAEGVQLLGTSSWAPASQKLMEAVSVAPMSVNSKHLAGIAFHQMGMAQPMVYKIQIVKHCCSQSEIQVPDYATTEANRRENYGKAKALLHDAYMQSIPLPGNIRSQIAFSYAMLMQSMGDDDLKRALITRSIEFDRDNLEALAVKEGQDRPEFHTHVEVQAHAHAHASASARASATSNVSFDPSAFS